MNKEEIKESLLSGGLSLDHIYLNEPMSGHTTFKTGGPVDILVEPSSLVEVLAAVKTLKEFHIKPIVLGKGSNVLVSDQGLEGVVLKISDRMSALDIQGTQVVVEAGCALSVLAKAVAREGLTGLEFASGIPGTVGGGLAMNAGAYDGEMKQFVEWVEVLTPELEVLRLSCDEMAFGYRQSILEREGFIALRCGLKLAYGAMEAIQEKMADFSERRRTKQPLQFPSAGSTFKRPSGSFAGKLIEEAGLGGLTVGGAQVSTLHCGFLISDGTATSSDVYQLIRMVQRKVFEAFEVELQPEVKLLGNFE